MSLYSVISEGRKATVKNVLRMLCLFCALFILPVSICATITLPPPSQPKTAFVRASNDTVYQIHYGGQGTFVENFSVSLNGETLPRDVAAELYIASKILNFPPYLWTYDELKGRLDIIYEDTARVQKWDRIASLVGNASVSILTTALTGGSISVGDAALKTLELLVPAVSTKLSQEMLLKRAYFTVDLFYLSATNNGQILDDLLESALRGREIHINEIKSAYKAFLKGGEYERWGLEIINEYVLLPEKWDRLSAFFKSLVPGVGQFFASTGQEWADYKNVLNMYTESDRQVESNVSVQVNTLFDGAAIAAARAELERKGFFSE